MNTDLTVVAHERGHASFREHGSPGLTPGDDVGRLGGDDVERLDASR
jgi:hypothetical protein